MGQLCFIINWGSLLMIKWEWRYYKLGQLLQMRAAVITNWGSYYKFRKTLLQVGTIITNWGITVAFKISKLRFILRILTCSTLNISKYCVLWRYSFTSFGLKYKVSKLDLVISSKRFVSGFGEPFWHKLVFNAEKRQCLKLYQTELKLMLRVLYITFAEFPDRRISFACSNNYFLNSAVRSL